LAAKPACYDDDDSCTCHPAPGERDQAAINGGWQIRGVSRIKAKLHGCGYFVDVLPAGAGGPDEPLIQFILPDGDGVGYRDHPGLYTQPTCDPTDRR